MTTATDASVQHPGPAHAPATATTGGRTFNLFFLRGHMRSGTNWCGALLNLHPKIVCEGEFHLEILASAVKRYTTEAWSLGSREPLKSKATAMFEQMVRESLLTLADRKPGALWLGDRTPAPVDPHIPGARHIVIIRDGRDVLVSWTFHQLRHGWPHNFPPKSEMQPLLERFKADPDLFTANPELLLSHEGWVRSQARQWRTYIREHHETIARANRGEISARILPIRYEDLHADTESGRAEMYRFLDLDPAEAEPLSEKSKTVAGFKREDPKSFYRKGAVGDWPPYFTPEASRWFAEEAGEELIEMGYETTTTWRGSPR